MENLRHEFHEFSRTRPETVGAAKVPEILYRELSFEVVGAAMEVHRELGPGYLEAVYHKALEHELTLRGLPFESRKCLRVLYKGFLVGEYETDLLVDDRIVLELKAVSSINANHIAQVHHYLAATGYHLGIILNFGTASLTMKRIAKYHCPYRRHVPSTILREIRAIRG